MGKKVKLEVQENAQEEEQAVEGEPTRSATKLSYEEKLQYVLPIAQPIATRKLAKKVFKVAKKARLQKSLAIGVKNIKKCILRGQKGFLIIAGDSDPMDLVSHFPVLCEENNVPYIWVPSRQDFGNAVSGAPTIAAFVKPHETYQSGYDEAFEKLKDLPHPI